MSCGQLAYREGGDQAARSAQASACGPSISWQHNGRDLRKLPLFERKARPERLIVAANANWLHYSESFDDGLELLKAADRLGLEGIVCDWIKVKCETWREANKER
jgi:hypothetical protein